ncbi:MAG: YajQ family cyclic di-GMP-binding protein [Gammaproteobacteria bacterium]|nr:YajQ family cyclic di-GMP-binding protein [Gammaproteobacteria bacterium]
MPSFDIVSELNMHEVTNAVDQANRELGSRFDFRGVEASFELGKDTVTMAAQEEFQLQQMEPMLQMAFIKRKLDSRALGEHTESKSGKQVKWTYPLKQGVDQTTAKKIVKMIKDAKLKVQAAIQGDSVRVTGKKRDDLQEVIAFLRGSEEIEIPLQFNNFRD